MTLTPRLVATAVLALLTLSACNPTASPAENAALAAEQNSVTSGADANQVSNGNSAGGMDDDMMHDRMMNDDAKAGMGEMPKGNMPAMKDDSMSNSQSMPKDKPMTDDMGDM